MSEEKRAVMNRRMTGLREWRSEAGRYTTSHSVVRGWANYWQEQSTRVVKFWKALNETKWERVYEAVVSRLWIKWYQLTVCRWMALLGKNCGRQLQIGLRVCCWIRNQGPPLTSRQLLPCGSRFSDNSLSSTGLPSAANNEIIAWRTHGWISLAAF